MRCCWASPPRRPRATRQRHRWRRCRSRRRRPWSAVARILYVDAAGFLLVFNIYDKLHQTRGLRIFIASCSHIMDIVQRIKRPSPPQILPITDRSRHPTNCKHLLPVKMMECATIINCFPPFVHCILQLQDFFSLPWLNSVPLGVSPRNINRKQ